MQPEVYAAFKAQFPPDRFLDRVEDLERYQANTIGCQRNIAAIVKPISVTEVITVIHLANQFLIPIYPISRGNNWGYGSANPVTHDALVIDLSLMRQITPIDEELGIFALEPGVTYGQLAKFLSDRQLNYMVPVHGGGPNCSLVGNALERGYGITPQTDHFGLVMALEAVLPNGEIYRGALSEAGGPAIDSLFKWGIGPYLDGLFSQGSFGVVTQMTLVLSPRPLVVRGFIGTIKTDDRLEDVVTQVRQILRTVGGNMGGINIMNDYRLLSMMEPFPEEYREKGVIPQPIVDAAIQRHDLGAWAVVGGIYGHPLVAEAVQQVILDCLRPHVEHLMFFDDELQQSEPSNSSPLANVKLLKPLLEILRGIPNQIALPLAYWRSGKPQSIDRNPAQDGCGLIWYPPLVPMKSDDVRNYVEMVKAVCRDHQINPLITLTALSDRCFDSSVPILYDRQNPEERDRAVACYQQLYQSGAVLGFLPYRLNIDSISLMTDSSKPYWKLVKLLKQAIDPNTLLSPGRYL